ncbi:hypothetical protein Tco_0381156, partial [Tanacetum coccineum]
MSMLPLADISAPTLLYLTHRHALNILIGHKVCGSIVKKKILQSNVMHCTAKDSIAHNFLRLKEGFVYLVKNFTVVTNKDEFCVIRFDDFMLEFDGETTVQKDFLKSDGFTRYPFQLVEIDELEPTNNKYLIDSVGYVINVDRLYLSSTSSTLIINDKKIPLLMRLKTDDRYKLKLEISDETVEVVVVMFDETARVLLKCSTSSILDYEGQDEEASLGLPPDLVNIVDEDVEEGANSTTAAAYDTSKAYELKRLNKAPTVATPSKPDEEKKRGRKELEDSDAEVSFVANSQSKGGDVACSDILCSKSLGKYEFRWERFHYLFIASTHFYTGIHLFFYVMPPGNNHVDRPSLSNILHTYVMIHSDTIIRRDGTVQSFCGLKLSYIGIPNTETSSKPSKGGTGVEKRLIFNMPDHPFPKAGPSKI